MLHGSDGNMFCCTTVTSINFVIFPKTYMFGELHACTEIVLYLFYPDAPFLPDIYSTDSQLAQRPSLPSPYTLCIVCYFLVSFPPLKFPSLYGLRSTRIYLPDGPHLTRQNYINRLRPRVFSWHFLSMSCWLSMGGVPGGLRLADRSTDSTARQWPARAWLGSGRIRYLAASPPAGFWLVGRASRLTGKNPCVRELEWKFSPSASAD